MSSTTGPGKGSCADRRSPSSSGSGPSGCLPSLSLGPSLRAAAERFDGRFRFASVDVDASPQVAERQGIVGLPTVLILAGGRELARRIGSMRREDLLRLLEAMLEASVDLHQRVAPGEDGGTDRGRPR